MNADELSQLAHQALRVAHGIDAHLHRLRTTPVTVSDLLLGSISGHAFDTQSLAAVAKSLDAAIKEHGADAEVVAENEAHTVSGLRELIAGCEQRVRPFVEAQSA